MHGMDYGIEQDTVKYWHVVGCLLPSRSLFHMRWLSINFQLDVIWFLRINYALFFLSSTFPSVYWNQRVRSSVLLNELVITITIQLLFVIKLVFSNFQAIRKLRSAFGPIRWQQHRTLNWRPKNNDAFQSHKYSRVFHERGFFLGKRKTNYAYLICMKPQARSCS